MKMVLGTPVALVVMSGVALAHEGEHDMGLADAVAHVLTSPYHLAVLGIVAVAGVGVGRMVLGRARARR